jgi:hypothetical protein
VAVGAASYIVHFPTPQLLSQQLGEEQTKASAAHVLRKRPAHTSRSRAMQAIEVVPIDKVAAILRLDMP